MSTPFHLVTHTTAVSDQVMEAVRGELVTVHPLVGNTLHRETLILLVNPTKPLAVLIEWHLAEAADFADTCARVRGDGIHVIALVSSVQCAVTAIALGADTMHLLPASLDLLHAQMLGFRRAHQSRTEPVDEHAADTRRLHVGELSLDVHCGTLHVAEKEIRLPPRQARVLACLLQSPGVAVTRAALLSDAWGWEFDPGTNVVAVYIHYLRRKLAEAGFGGSIEMVRGHGYRLVLGAEDGLVSQTPGDTSRTLSRHDS